MNPLTNVRNITKLNERELTLGVDVKNSWHNMYKDSAWIFIGGLNYDMSEGDIITVLSQFGEIVNINLIRDQKSGKSKGYCFVCYEDQRSTVLAVDNFNGIKLLNRIIRCDHVSNYRMPKEHDDLDPITKQLYEEGCAPKDISPNGDTKQILQISINIKSERNKQYNRDSNDSSDSSHKKSKKSNKRKRSHSKDRKEKYLSSKRSDERYDRSERHGRERQSRHSHSRH